MGYIDPGFLRALCSLHPEVQVEPGFNCLWMPWDSLQQLRAYNLNLALGSCFCGDVSEGVGDGVVDAVSPRSATA